MQKLQTRWFAVVALAFVLAGLGTSAYAQSLTKAGGTTVVTPQVRAELLAHAPEGIAPGKPVWLGLQLTHKPEWHTYWKNSGDSGLATQLQWTLPAGVAAGEIAWTLPKKIPIGNLLNYGYEGTVLLPVPLIIGPEFKPGEMGSELQVKLKAAWLVCQKECIPEEGEFALRVSVNGSTALNSAAFAAAARAQPLPLPEGVAGGASANSLRIEGNALALTLHSLPAKLHGKKLDFFPETQGVIETAAPWTQAWTGAVWSAKVPLSPQRDNSPSTMPVVVVALGEGWRTDLKVQGNWPSVSSQSAFGLPTGATSALGTTTSPPISLGLGMALLGALIGGIILNLMPCVFPVLAIKMVSFARHAGAGPTGANASTRSLRLQGVAYTVGVVTSFLALGALMLALRAAGEQLGWGFQLQSPAAVAALAVLFTLIGLNLAGVFELGSVLPSSVASLEARHPMVNALLSGVLAAAVASPCTAPFMGASLGLAATLPSAEALLVFFAIGLGMALPFLVASWLPAVARWIPRPGAWMVVFRKAMAFPMFATVVWLVWVLGQQSGIDGAGALLAGLVALSMVVWAATLSGRSRAVLGGLAVAGFAGLVWAVGPYITQGNAAASSQSSERWTAWQPGSVERITASGQAVLVDFTAAWCVTCQYNKKVVLSDKQVLADLQTKNVALLRADWTKRDPAITAALAQLGRNGVPVYVFYKAGQAPQLLSELLDVNEVRAAIAKL